MPVSSYERCQISLDPAFQGRVATYLSLTSTSALNEPKDRAHHTERCDYARAVLAGDAPLQPAALCCISQPGLYGGADFAKKQNGDYGITDTDLQFTVEAVYDSLAGAEQGPATSS